MKKQQLYSLYFLSFLLALISLLYEFSLAQLITIFYGGTYLTYCAVIGIYTFSLGLGSFYFHYIKEKKDATHIMFNVETAISIAAFTSPFWVILFCAKFIGSYSSSLSMTISFIPVFLCGFLSGVELPCLMSFGEQNGNSLKILFYDYLGMFIGAVAFSLFLIPLLGTMKLLWLLSFLNLVSAFIFLKIFGTKRNKKQTLLLISLMVVPLMLFINESSILKFFREVHHF